MKRPETDYDRFYLGSPTAFGTRPTEGLMALRPELTEGGLVLDVGAGNGRDSLYLAREGFAVVALDISFPALATLRDAARRLGIDGIATLCCDVRRGIRWLRGIQGIVAVTLLDHLDLEDAKGVVDGMWECLVPGGWLYCQVHSEEDPGHRKGEGASETSSWIKHYFKQGEIEQLLAEKFEIRQSRAWEEMDLDHGPAHTHAFRSVQARRRG